MLSEIESVEGLSGLEVAETIQIACTLAVCVGRLSPLFRV